MASADLLRCFAKPVFFFCVFLGSISPQYPFSQESADSQKSTDRLNSIYRQKKQEDQRREDRERAEMRIKSLSKSSLLADIHPALVSCDIYDPDEGPRELLRAIKIDQDDVKIAVDVGDLISKYTDTHINEHKLCELYKAFNQRYLDAGFSTSILQMDKTRLDEGYLRLDVVWGRLSQITINGRARPASWWEKVKYQAIFRQSQIDRPLNVRDIDQTIDNSQNGLLDMTATILNDPDRDGYHILDIGIKRKHNHVFSVNIESIDSNGDQLMEPGILPTLKLNGPVGHGDLFTLSPSLRRNEPAGNKTNRHQSMRYTLPYAWYRYTFLWGLDEIETAFSLTTSRNYSLEFKHTLDRTRDRVISMLWGLKFESKETDRDIFPDQNDDAVDLSLALDWLGGFLGGHLSATAGLSFSRLRIRESSINKVTNGTARSWKAEGSVMWNYLIFREARLRYALNAGWQYA
ncbi:MAG: hypothetical protein KZQ66_14075 [Candidatus Thiodiazotropha sp. (ex Lucinoma aequizonata)]|nr:hypothetical protein [Candidatus Thiodiazotropha sp. (ex Lucinoma aequizonata)]MCU7886848.1 hypothetical protein [Candidatus Thiodiazotropha sp. (ex Lucinoma aequizonata)]MCU7897896.1 hypothetical protein [Candidatus Thiodiazotropha sp. (ex Lucinoma aequizonata)]MCU7902982.1 hypothetical protein [Candidatus Thiodiazotropha sp. (ex Lucinoma aequizonata)]MCU7908855.1 hypothetical protein [Candidatus Thiodiazotropha sp. (ex Lucinoma aequizonata)]